MELSAAQSAIQQLLVKLSILRQHASGFRETWDEVVADGQGSQIAYQTILEICACFGAAGCGVPSLDLDDSAVDVAELGNRVEAREFGGRWRLILRKSECTSNREEGVHVGFFALRSSFREWLEHLEPFSPSCPLCLYPKLLVLVNGLAEPFATASCEFVGTLNSSEPSASRRHSMPSDQVVRQCLHVLCSDDVVFWPERFSPASGSFRSDCAKSLLSASESVLSACLATTYGKNGRVGLKGIKHHDVPLAADRQSGSVTEESVSQLAELVSWAYAEKRETRLRLVRDRLSLDLVVCLVSSGRLRGSS